MAAFVSLDTVIVAINAKLRHHALTLVASTALATA
jgi:hypothetical protein